MLKFFGKISVLLACLLLSGFLLHDIEYDHEHPEFLHKQNQTVAMHGEEKKLFHSHGFNKSLPFLLYLTPGLVFFMVRGSRKSGYDPFFSKLFDTILSAIKEGRLQPKFCA